MHTPPCPPRLQALQGSNHLRLDSQIDAAARPAFLKVEFLGRVHLEVLVREHGTAQEQVLALAAGVLLPDGEDHDVPCRELGDDHLVVEAGRRGSRRGLGDLLGVRLPKDLARAVRRGRPVALPQASGGEEGHVEPGLHGGAGLLRRCPALGHPQRGGAGPLRRVLGHAVYLQDRLGDAGHGHGVLLARAKRGGAQAAGLVEVVRHVPLGGAGGPVEEVDSPISSQFPCPSVLVDTERLGNC
mmetsp:Transcript_119443/g.372103  ORF Transcript_119443/g.372103 Transcript_119443/m.372103 type:complete len:242 (+) Transcript_119443:196-921(+)